MRSHVIRSKEQKEISRLTFFSIEQFVNFSQFVLITLYLSYLSIEPQKGNRMIFTRLLFITDLRFLSRAFHSSGSLLIEPKT